ncbi:Alcohol dehydrogenase catalytic domain-containing protein [Sulfidibacter corallicola]|uniref:Alcohol dehydrogenase catalytic domain-containing protein n=1 Tax=Sulfidibacter corallicola TaxID=2818388 RepID=A0A8A4TLV1_SULCO|nr:alcohol dehydrogenase catalytic domain-containing protein [Sulfidibacter corallicola]QTD50543.1 alcohol dehydrogenase catalytic domain-containing protein [Sulfidibacter corallicola]
MNQQDLSFDAPDYYADGTFHRAHYRFHGNETEGWHIFRDGTLIETLGPGYEVVDVERCGVCSTDLARRFLPYPLPQVIGHEVTGLREGRRVVVEINASHAARNRGTAHCPFCREGLSTHCPDRITLGINRLPGGFAPWLLAPTQAIIPVSETIPSLAAALTEPFAAALQGVEATWPKSGDRVAVLGPRRLGMLLLAALRGFRTRQNLDFHITALARHDALLALSSRMGADDTVDLRTHSSASLANSFDIVFDTTGKPEGFETALKLARRVVHLKSTNGMPVLGLRHLTDLVVDELALLPGNYHHLGFTWPVERDVDAPRANHNVFVSPSVPDHILEEEMTQTARTGGQRVFHRLTFEHALQRLKNQPEDGHLFPKDSPVPRFDLALVTNLAEADRVIRPIPDEEFSLVRPRGAILLVDPGARERDPSPLAHAIWERGIQVHSSRCGDFRRALAIMENQPELTNIMVEEMITHQFDLEDIEDAFSVASDSSRSIKVVVNAPESS